MPNKKRDTNAFDQRKKKLFFSIRLSWISDNKEENLLFDQFHFDLR